MSYDPHYHYQDRYRYSRPRPQSHSGSRYDYEHRNYDCYDRDSRDRLYGDDYEYDRRRYITQDRRDRDWDARRNDDRRYEYGRAGRGDSYNEPRRQPEDYCAGSTRRYERDELPHPPGRYDYGYDGSDRHYISAPAPQRRADARAPSYCQRDRSGLAPHPNEHNEYNDGCCIQPTCRLPDHNVIPTRSNGQNMLENPGPQIKRYDVGTQQDQPMEAYKNLHQRPGPALLSQQRNDGTQREMDETKRASLGVPSQLNKSSSSNKNAAHTTSLAIKPQEKDSVNYVTHIPAQSVVPADVLQTKTTAHAVDYAAQHAPPLNGPKLDDIANSNRLTAQAATPAAQMTLLLAIHAQKTQEIQKIREELIKLQQVQSMDIIQEKQKVSVRTEPKVPAQPKKDEDQTDSITARLIACGTWISDEQQRQRREEHERACAVLIKKELMDENPTSAPIATTETTAKSCLSAGGDGLLVPPPTEGKLLRVANWSDLADTDSRRRKRSENSGHMSPPSKRVKESCPPGELDEFLDLS